VPPAPKLIKSTDKPLPAKEPEDATQKSAHQTPEVVTPAPKKTASEPVKKEDTPTIAVKPHAKDVRKNWLDFIAYVKKRKVWMAQDLQRADTIKQEKEELHLTYSDPANCTVLRQKDNQKLLTEYTLDFFQKPLKIRFILPEIDTSNGNSKTALSPHRKRQELANDPLVIMTAEVFNGQVGDIRVGPKSR